MSKLCYGAISLYNCVTSSAIHIAILYNRYLYDNVSESTLCVRLCDLVSFFRALAVCILNFLVDPSRTEYMHRAPIIGINKNPRDKKTGVKNALQRGPT